MSEFLENMEEENPNFANELPVPVYDLKKKIMGIADRLLDKSIDFDSISGSEMGTTVENNIPYMNKLIESVVFQAEREYLDGMKIYNEIDLKECILILNKILIEGCTKLENYHIRYLFIDEFQDTDDVQIEVFQRLQKAINADCKLFVVGDLKQSIYRFRGAKLSAFTKLKGNNSDGWDVHKLNINYRTDSRLLNLYDEIFKSMGSQGTLPYTYEKDRLSSEVCKEAKDEELLVCVPCHAKDDDIRYETIMGIIKAEKIKLEKLMAHKELKKEERTIAVLVRNNWQVDSVLKAAEKDGGELNIEIKTGGDLFQLESTIDFYKLVSALCNNTNPVYLANFIESNYTDLILDYAKLRGLSETETKKELVRVLDEFFELRMRKTWRKVVSEVYSQPVLFVLKQIYEALRPWKQYSKQFDGQKFYMSNYEYLLEKIIKFSRVDALTLNQINVYLGINILTGQRQMARTVEFDDKGIHIVCTTVHKSKGLEYATVILPYTDDDIGNTNKVKLEANYLESKMSYVVQFENKIRESNSNYCDPDEFNEQIAEESRILYVALTRAIKNCIWIKNIDDKSPISWGSILED
ncbi:UvrD-helicase domain-containing protein [Anaerocolumna xylanovorans]|uniref:DNA 3'-5' helicase n=1 Tax=Anaerocolumna xylanovorans DSM 12503 TaxID=1121345 RepID=A0A1M7YL79_9FIRM|nr:UvrD-helicase domain-containing protein [Anaerocolumna xylanovorans]SHO53367.1 UvrD/REP helicase N-terminal domain-containing protein [Anaerocolumna xylanovorans DSM 12503]